MVGGGGGERGQLVSERGRERRGEKTLVYFDTFKGLKL
jgi:hypothetical protein